MRKQTNRASLASAFTRPLLKLSPSAPLNLLQLRQMRFAVYAEVTQTTTTTESRKKVKVAQFYSLLPHGLYSPWNSPGQDTGVGILSVLQGIFSTQRSNPGLPHCRRILYQLNHKRFFFFLLATLCLHCCKMAFSSCSEGECGILEYEVKLALGSITMNKASGGDEIPVELFKILNDDAVKVFHSVCQQIWKSQ